jgi:hypothetical protein
MPGFAPSVAKRKARDVRLVFDRSRDRARASIAEVEALLRAYNREWGRGRLRAARRGRRGRESAQRGVCAISRHRRAPARSFCS